MSPAALAAASLSLDLGARSEAELARLSADAAAAREAERVARSEASAACSLKAAAEATCEGLAGKFAEAVSGFKGEGKRDRKNKRELKEVELTLKKKQKKPESVPESRRGRSRALEAPCLAPRYRAVAQEAARGGPDPPRRGLREGGSGAENLSGEAPGCQERGLEGAQRGEGGREGEEGGWGRGAGSAAGRAERGG